MCELARLAVYKGQGHFTYHSPAPCLDEEERLYTQEAGTGTFTRSSSLVIAAAVAVSVAARAAVTVGAAGAVGAAGTAGSRELVTAKETEFGIVELVVGLIEYV